MLECMSVPERRSRRPGSTRDVYMNCRLCWKRVQLDPARAEVVDWQVVYHCQECESTFLIRTEDAIALGLQPPAP